MDIENANPGGSMLHLDAADSQQFPSCPNGPSPPRIGFPSLSDGCERRSSSLTPGGPICWSPTRGSATGRPEVLGGHTRWVGIRGRMPALLGFGAGCATDLMCFKASALKLFHNCFPVSSPRCCSVCPWRMPRFHHPSTMEAPDRAPWKRSGTTRRASAGGWSNRWTSEVTSAFGM